MKAHVQEAIKFDFLKSTGAHKNKIRIGPEYQADVPNINVPYTETRAAAVHEDPIWRPDKELNAELFDAYLINAEQERRFNLDQALYFLHCNHYDIIEACDNLSNYRVNRKRWTQRERQIFAIALRLHGKNFARIKIMLPGRNISELIDFYHVYRAEMSPFEAAHYYEGAESSEQMQGMSIEEIAENFFKCHKQGTFEAPQELSYQICKTEYTRLLMRTKARRLRIKQLEDDVKALQAGLNDFGQVTPQYKHLRKWTTTEKALFETCLKNHCEDCVTIATILGTKSAKQVAEYAKKNNIEIVTKGVAVPATAIALTEPTEPETLDSVPTLPET